MMRILFIIILFSMISFIEILSQTEKELIEKIDLIINEGDFEKANKAIDDALKILPESSELLRYKAGYYLSMKDSDTALKYYKMALDKDINNLNVYKE